MLQALPVDVAVKYGKLDNGLTYYIRHNEMPRQRAEFFIAQRVGSILEEDGQSGLAHFLEHMAFNGTKNFPGKAMVDCLENIGVKFGENLNAYTAFDETVYNISNVPVVREGIVDTCLLVLHDWSGFISLDAAEIEKERGVIREEMRTGGHASFRQVEKLLPMLMPGSRYAKRLPIGTEEVVMNFKPEELRAYYEKWYRPDLQAVIVVGDIDPEVTEQKIKRLFADIPRPVDPAPRVYYGVDDNETVLTGIVKDKEATNTSVSIFYKHDPLTEEELASMKGLLTNYLKSVSSQMMNERFSEILQKANPPFLRARGGDNSFLYAKTKDAWNVTGIAKENGVEETFKSIVRETERIKRFGFTESEYERAKSNLIKYFENAYNERAKSKNIGYAREYADHFLNGGYIPGIEYEYRSMKNVADRLPVESVNRYMEEMLGNRNVVIALTCPEKEGLTYPSESDLSAWFDEIRTEPVEAYTDNVSREPLLSELPGGGEIVASDTKGRFGTRVYRLSNGVRVVIKPTRYKDNEILMSATSPGGASLFPETETTNIKLYGTLCDVGGLGKFSAIDLRKLLAGKNVSVYPQMQLRTEGFAGNASTEDFETMLQLLYLHFTAPRVDEEAFQSVVQRLKSQIESREADPSVALTDTLQKSLYSNLARMGRLRADDFREADYQKIMDWRKDRYRNAADFTFIFTGNIDPEASKDVIARYLGALPSTGRRSERPAPVNVACKRGIVRNTFRKEMQNPLTTVVNIYSGRVKPTQENRIKMDLLRQILRLVYTEKVREDEGGTYGVGVNGSISDYPEGQTLLQISFDTGAEKKDLLNEIVHRELNNIAQDGPRPEDFRKVVEFTVKKHAENEQENAYWLSIIRQYEETKYDAHTRYSAILNRITPKDIRDFAHALLKQKNLVEVVMVGVK
ncbi:MAG: insulinase family protein [Dysgonamonadaceae bacterium]|jgi:zinc protease|nr:insulinase family protein [Dysgonamonadaceae bacterium]